jgi:hypothetical protein
MKYLMRLINEALIALLSSAESLSAILFKAKKIVLKFTRSYNSTAVLKSYY